MKLSALDTRAIGPPKPASTRAVTTPSPTPPECRVSSATRTRPVGQRLAHDVVDRQGREEPQIHDPSRDAVLRQAPGHAQAHAQPVAKGEDGEIHAIAINAGAPDRDVRVRVVGWWVFAQPAAVAGAVQVALVV
jgi:hypothetical protein